MTDAPEPLHRISKLVQGQILDLMRASYGIEDIAVGLDIDIEHVRLVWDVLKHNHMLDQTYRTWRKQ